jgi:hypothetical protein
METGERFESWCVVEIMGHQTFAGLVTEQVIGGCPFVRVDVPAIADDRGRETPAFSKLFGQDAIYSITPCSEELARLAQARQGTKPLNMYTPELYPPSENRKALAGVRDDDDYDDDILEGREP